ncbi:hypothetical protein K2173_005765 [Erythroxylum novogranatense]|uniref:TLC domain-containing protein n=1 Tax=Erythroxylum novogranatense TaxID=1862640 RepID=A0AAV8U603_9ROSI|nr:hypothetical protein K2173_005765 [Erythroxylum novogranatense]
MDTVFLHSPTLLISFLMFLLVYLFAYFIVFRNWSPKHRTEASSSFMSLVHGTPAVMMAIHALLSTKASPTFSSRNSATQNRVLEFSMGYFIMDILHYLVFFPSDYLIILHHLATLYVFVTCRYIVCHEAYGLLVLHWKPPSINPIKIWKVTGKIFEKKKGTTNSL